VYAFIPQSDSASTFSVLFLISVTKELSGVSRCPAGILPSIRSGAEIDLLSLRLSVSQGASLGDFLLAPACPIEKAWEGHRDPKLMIFFGKIVIVIYRPQLNVKRWGIVDSPHGLEAEVPGRNIISAYHRTSVRIQKNK